MEDDNFFDDANAEAQTAIATKAANCNRSKRRIGVLGVPAIFTLRFQIALPLGLDLLHGGTHEECEGGAVVSLPYANGVLSGVVTANRGNAVPTIRDIEWNSNCEIVVPLVVGAVAPQTGGGVELETAGL